MTALIALLGGVRATAFAALALALLVLLGIQSVRLESAWADEARARADLSEVNEELADARLAASEAARAEERAKAEASALIAQAYERGKTDAEATGKRAADDLRAGNLQLREHWRGCETARLSAAATAAGQPDGGADLRAAGAGDLVRAGAACDAHVRGLQAQVRSDRGLDASRPGN